ncbi:hypothetical protein [Nostoc sp. 'Peltigera membranacea cyanobiont' 232]|uniref:hypothetical protein n=1 Tax=Nostoc sp. 'Peltigera membranacea cyanobiont' 232 TaxID=2014531 RepID=UPI001676E51A|nr:hypothetical protein [Nostoc sp. 'Peltigera membranacea cyanobiont' 232]
MLTDAKTLSGFSCITHAHARSQMACGIYISIAVALLARLYPFFRNGILLRSRCTNA